MWTEGYLLLDYKLNKDIFRRIKNSINHEIYAKLPTTITGNNIPEE